MKRIIVLLVLTFLFGWVACSYQSEDASESQEKSKSDSMVSETAAPPTEEYDDAVTDEATGEGENRKGKKAEETDKPSSAAQQNKVENKPEQKTFYDSVYVAINSNRKLIKTANLQFRVADVEKATVKIEQIAYRFGGFILKSGITKKTVQANTSRVNNDTVLEVGIAKIENNITLRVPQFLLDSTLARFSELWIELDERTVTAQDVTIDYLANELRAKIHQKTAVNINKAAQNNNTRLNDVVNAEQTANQFLEVSIQKQVDNLTLQDRVDYATVTLKIYQDDLLYKKKIASYTLEDYEPGFGSDFVDALAFGWKIILGFILFLAKGWSVILISIAIFLAIYYFVRFLIRRKRNKA